MTDLHDAAVAGAKAAPPAVAVGLNLFGVPVSDVLTVILIIYTVAQLGFLLYDRMTGKKGRDE